MTISEKERQNAVTVYPAGYEFDDLPEPDPKLEQETSEFDKFKEEMHEANDYAKITVSKKQTDARGQPIGRQKFSCFECGIEDYTFSQLCSRIRDEYGTGLYEIQGRDSNGKFKFGKTVGIAAPKVDGEETKNNPGALIDSFSNAMERHQTRTEQMLKQFVGPQTGGDAFDQMTKMMTAMGAMMGAIGITPQTPVAPKTMLEQMQEFALMKELIGEMAGGGAGGDGNIYSLLTETIKNVGPLLGAALAAGQKDGTVNAAGIVQTNPKQIEGTTVEAENENTENVSLEAMRPQVAFLLKQCKGGANPDDVAAFVIKMIPDNQLENVEGFLQQENALDLCIQLDAEVSEHREWFEKWQSAMLNSLAQIFDTGGEAIPLKSDDDKELTSEPDEAQTPLVDVAGKDATEAPSIAKPTTDKPSDT